jgi:acetyl/propionyl-CoA carboxylase alpha subunit
LYHSGAARINGYPATPMDAADRCGKLGRTLKKRPLKKLLIANRGEIALRIIRTARAEGLATVAVYSEADRGAAHVAAADDARLIGPAEAALSYLSIEAILAAARATGADAIHPGYGFLSERPEFARAVEDAGMIFVGPPASVMAALGDKVRARQLAIKCGVPVIPGTEAADLPAARAFAAEAGFPILVKAAAGGGGRGMRIVGEPAQLETSLEAAAREAKAAFGDGRIFVEKYLARPRHIEVQLVGDGRGKVVALGERECSIQRRYQKLIEESPSPGLDDATRAAMADAAIRLARAAGYRNAGTAEFLFDSHGFYFLEVNARLQVEHPVTEMRFGCDLVAEQLRIAAGEPLADPPSPRGWAIECRVNSEDAEHDFRPSVGRVMHLHLPAGAGVRVDTFLEGGAEISGYYDGLLAKVIGYGETRDVARRRVAAALDEFLLAGVQHTASFLRAVVMSDAFKRGDLSTHFIEEHFSSWRIDPQAEDAALIGAALAVTGALGSSAARSADSGDGHPSTSASPWATMGAFRLWERR